MGVYREIAYYFSKSNDKKLIHFLQEKKTKISYCVSFTRVRVGKFAIHFETPCIFRGNFELGHPISCR